MPHLAALVYAWISLFGARVLFFEKKLKSPVNRIWITWVLLAPCVMFLEPGPLYFLCSALILFVLKPLESVDKVIYWIGILPAAPDFIGYTISFAGIQTLFTFTHWKLSVLVILVPLYFSHYKHFSLTKWTKIDRLVFIFVVYISLMHFREWNLTSVLRVTLDNFLLFYVPYFMVTRILNDLESIKKCIKSFIYLSIILVAVGMVTSLTRWEFYLVFDYDTFYAMRGGDLRIQLTMNTMSIATIMSIGIVVLEYLRLISKRGHSNLVKPGEISVNYGALRMWMLRALLLAIVLATGNRGGLLQFAIAPIVFYILISFSNSARSLILFLCSIVVVLFLISIPELEWEAYDDTGTFEYRYQIILAALAQLGEFPLFGRMYFLDTGNFDHLVQGEGIVDIVNWYLQIALEFGGIGLLLFLGIFYGTIISLYKEFKMTEKGDDRRYLLACMISILIPYVIAIGTTSNVSLVGVLGVLIVALSNAVICSKNNQRIERKNIKV